MYVTFSNVFAPLLSIRNGNFLHQFQLLYCLCHFHVLAGCKVPAYWTFQWHTDKKENSLKSSGEGFKTQCASLLEQESLLQKQRVKRKFYPWKLHNNTTTAFHVIALPTTAIKKRNETNHLLFITIMIDGIQLD